MTVLDIINSTNINTKHACYLPLKVVPLNESQGHALKAVEANTLTTVIGAAGTGKTRLITAVTAHFVLTGRNVLIVSKSDHAVDVVCDKLNNLGAEKIAIRGGRKDSQYKLAHYLLNLIEGKVDLSDEGNGNILKYILTGDNKEIIKMLKHKRNLDLKELVSDIDNRQQMIIQAKACMAVKKSLKNKIMSKIDFTPILKAIPIWCVTSAEISNLLPMVKDMFNLVVVDESSEMDIASFLPCAYRAEKAMIVGDSQQLTSLRFMDNKKNMSFFAKHDISSDMQQIWNYAKNSLFDFAQYYSQECIMLNEQYRMPENVFKFSNDKFYGDRIKSAKTANVDALKKVFVGGETSANKTCNFKECEAIIKYLKNWLNKNENNNKTIAILSMFHAQVDLIEKAIKRIFPLSEIEKHGITVRTANGSQGSQWDTVLLSWCIADNSKHQSLTFTNNLNRFNVITTRAEEKLINFYSTKNLGDSLLGQYLSSINE